MHGFTKLAQVQPQRVSTIPTKTAMWEARAAYSASRLLAAPQSMRSPRRVPRPFPSSMFIDASRSLVVVTLTFASAQVAEARQWNEPPLFAAQRLCNAGGAADPRRRGRMLVGKRICSAGIGEQFRGHTWRLAHRQFSGLSTLVRQHAHCFDRLFQWVCGMAVPAVRQQVSGGSRLELRRRRADDGWYSGSALFDDVKLQ
ncbi:hypothetical protein GGD83_002829 [Rhodoblastus sphagnicola]|nr:hypothetical protein [Rhodoblastus sphagnicola]